MVAELGVSFIFPSNKSVTRCRPLLRGVPSGAVPPLHRSYCGTPTSPPSSLTAIFLSRSTTAEIHRPERRGPPRFLGNPLHACPALRPRRDHEPGHSGVALLVGSPVLPSANTSASAPTTHARFQGSITRPASSLSTLRRRRYRRPRKTHFRLVTHLGRAGFDPQGSFERFQLIASPFPRLSLAHCRRSPCRSRRKRGSSATHDGVRRR